MSIFAVFVIQRSRAQRTKLASRMMPGKHKVACESTSKITIVRQVSGYTTVVICFFNEQQAFPKPKNPLVIGDVRASLNFGGNPYAILLLI